MQAQSYIPFTREMKKEYTILMPTMLPRHFELIGSVLGTYGYKMELLKTSGQKVVDAGLRYVHNDACYPAVLVIGQFLEAITSGRYDPHKVALILFQTGGGCRASNYISLLRKALARAGYAYVPVISFSLAGLEHHPGFNLGIAEYHGMAYAVLYGDLLLTLVNQTKPYELHPGDAEALAERWTAQLGKALGAGKHIRYSDVQKTYRQIVADFAAIPKRQKETVKVGIVGEIFVKYSPLGNNNLEQFLVDEGAEVVTPGLLDFCLYCVYNSLTDCRLYGRRRLLYPFAKLAFDFLCKKKREMNEAIEAGGFRPMTPFEEVPAYADGYIGCGTKMGEGWLLTAEMLELAASGVKNIVCTQPFGCLPNHICGKGMMKPIKERNLDVNIVAIDYDPGATRVNQENRLKLMLANARDKMQESV